MSEDQRFEDPQVEPTATITVQCYPSTEPGQVQISVSVEGVAGLSGPEAAEVLYQAAKTVGGSDPDLVF